MSEPSRIGFASDHAGLRMKAYLIAATKNSFQIEDFGCGSDDDRCDYPDYASLLAEAVQSSRVDFGVAICGTGIGMAIACNRFAGVRAVVPWDDFSVIASRGHNGANIICFGERTVEPEVAKRWLELFLVSPMSGDERHVRRRGKLDELSKSSA